jgi:hypothetical protein
MRQGIQQWIAVKTTLDIPDDLASEVERHARREGRETAEHLVHLVRLAMLLEDLPLAEIRRFAGVLRKLVEARNRAVHGLRPAQVQTDPATGLPVIVNPPEAPETRPPRFEIDPMSGLRVIVSPPDAPIHSMSAQEALALEQSILEEQDLERAGLPL